MNIILLLKGLKFIISTTHQLSVLSKKKILIIYTHNACRDTPDLFLYIIIEIMENLDLFYSSLQNSSYGKFQRLPKIFAENNFKCQILTK